MCAVVVATDKLDATPISFDWWNVRILVDFRLAVAEIFDIVRLWLLYRGVEQPKATLVCWCGEPIELPDT